MLSHHLNVLTDLLSNTSEALDELFITEDFTLLGFLGG